jgi:ribosomal protein L7/L12
MSVKTLEILEQLKSLNRVETSELVKQIEVAFGVDASPKSWCLFNPSMRRIPAISLNQLKRSLMLS